eukprot:TRINITY_DN13090_c0_g1_i1.p2 TRINITY_DN13090_c0_g1~~TRINITY_DN13090_c0_g1_i1.p2  ORF type:complete len:225 (+),score=44.39 TRINITY_DN13090_c0_g1_i1:100-774(+)
MSWDEQFETLDRNNPISPEEKFEQQEEKDNEPKIEIQQLTPEQQEQLQLVENEKLLGNDKYKEGQLKEALEYYGSALTLLGEDKHKQFCEKRAVILGNRAAIYSKQENWEKVIQECNQALQEDPDYLKARLRRMTAAEKKDDVETAFNDATKILEQEPGNAMASQTKRKLEPTVMQRREKMKEEVVGKLKDLGNTILGKFGMSLDNFKAVQDPNSGGYSISYNP